MTHPTDPSLVLRIVRLAVVLTLSLCFFSSCTKQPEQNRPITDAQTLSTIPDEPAWFEEVAAKSGFTFHHSSGHKTNFYMPEMVTGGVGLLDFDGNGFLDVFCVNGGALDPSETKRPGNKLYRNLGNWKFEDVTDRAGIGGNGEYGMGCACADYDADGRVDIYVTHLNGGLLYHNNGDGTFTDVTRQAGITGSSWGTSAAFFDCDADGYLDLIVSNYIRWSRETELNCSSRGGLPDYCSPMNYKAPAVDTLYLNKTGSTFADVTISAGLGQAYGNGLGAVCADFNRDGRIDIFVANDGMPNQLWINNGNGEFADEALIRGCALNVIGMSRAGMGAVAVDVRQSGWLDLFVTHLVGEGNGWFVNTNGYFNDAITPKGPNAPSTPMTGFGVGFADFNQDGILDLYVANGRVKYGARDLDPIDPYAEPNTLLRGLGNGDFEEVKPQGGTERLLLGSSRGAAFGDLDNDGAIDLIVINKDAPAHVLRNVATSRGGWIMFRILDRRGVDAINASVRLEAAGRTQVREVIPNQGYCSSNDPRVHFGLGEALKVDKVVVRWRHNQEEVFGPFEPRQIIELHEGQGHEHKVINQRS